MSLSTYFKGTQRVTRSIYARNFEFSVPKNEDRFGLEVFFSLNDVLDMVFTIVANLSPHIIYHEGFCEVELVV